MKQIDYSKLVCPYCGKQLKIEYSKNNPDLVSVWCPDNCSRETGHCFGIHATMDEIRTYMWRIHNITF